MKRAHPNDTLKVEFTSIPDSRNFVGPKTSVEMGAITPSVIEIFEKNKHILTELKNDENVKKSKN